MKKNINEEGTGVGAVAGIGAVSGTSPTSTEHDAEPPATQKKPTEKTKNLSFKEFIKQRK